MPKNVPAASFGIKKTSTMSEQTLRGSLPARGSMPLSYHNSDAARSSEHDESTYINTNETAPYECTNEPVPYECVDETAEVIYDIW